MLSPEYYEGCADDILKLYEQLEDDIISDIVRRIMKTGIITETAKHQIEQLQEAGLLYDDILQIIASQTDATSQQVRALFEDAGVETVEIDNEVYRENGLVPVDIRQSPAIRRTLEAGYRKTLGNMKNLTLTTANTSQTAYMNACNQAYMQITSGAFSYQEAIKQAIQRTAQQGATVLYPSGHMERIDVAVRRAVLTGVGQTCREIGMMNAEESGCDIMEISAHSGARPDHAKWQGQLVSLSGKNAGKKISGKKVLSLRQIGYGKGDGFGGWNCRHDWYPFFEGYSTPSYSAKDLEKLDEKNILYNGKLYSQYEISQIQRQYEREIRSAKREQVAFKVAVEETDDPELKQVMQDSLNYSNSLVKDRQAKMRDFIKQTGQDRDYFSEHNYPKSNHSKKVVDNSESYGIIGINNGDVPTDDVTEAEEYARNVLGIPNVSYKGLDTFTANEFNKVLEEHFKEFPELKNQINFVGTCQERNRFIREKVKAYYITKNEEKYSNLNGELFTVAVEVEADTDTNNFMKNFQIKPKTYAQSFYGETGIDLSEFYGISINEDFGRNHKKFIESIKIDEKNGHLPVGCNTIKSVIDHEMGHQLDNLLDLKYVSSIRSVFNEFEKNPSEMKEKLSGYALDGFLKGGSDYRYSEPIAEAWSEYRNNPEPRETAEKVGKIVNRLYNQNIKQGGE